MPKNKFQDVIFTIMMVFIMVYAMICYNIALSTGGMSNSVFVAAFQELIIMMPIAFILEFFVIGNVAHKTAMKIVGDRNDNPFAMILAISAVTVAYMCPCMSFFATLFFKNAGSEFVAQWLQTAAFNFPMAFFWQIFYAGPLVRFLFGKIFNRSEASEEKLSVS